MIQPIEGFENEFLSLTEKKEALKVDKDLAIAKALQEVDEKFKERETLLDKLISMVSKEIEVASVEPEITETDILKEKDSCAEVKEEIQEEDIPVESGCEGEPILEDNRFTYGVAEAIEVPKVIL